MLQLQVGRRYVTRDGRVATIDRDERTGSEFPFAGRVAGESCPDIWASDGHWALDGLPSDYDLVAEVMDPPTVAKDEFEQEPPLPVEPTTDDVLDEVAEERASQNAKWGQQNHDLIEWLPILLEEVGEVARAINDVTTAKTRSKEVDAWENYREELIQVAAVAVAMVECMDRNAIEVD